MHFGMRQENIVRLFLCCLLSVLYFIVLYRTAWISDDAVITLHTVHNLLKGYGPVFNIGERVQAYTHPVWFLLLSIVSFVTRDIFLSAFLLSFGVSLYVFWLFLTRFTRQYVNIIFGAFVFIGSKAFIDYSTSGLENPLTHLLLLLFVFYSFQENENPGDRLVRLYCLAALLYLCRPDGIIFVFLPLLLFSYRCLFHKEDRRILYQGIILAFTFVFVWTAFALIYYGFPFPNTAYAKLMVDVPLWEKVLQGWNYIKFTFVYDSLTAYVIVIGFLYMLWSSTLSRTFAAGFVLYICYLLSIGGDFMAGRFFTSPFLISSIFLISIQFDYRYHFTYNSKRLVALILLCFVFISWSGVRGYWASLVLAQKLDVHWQRYEKTYGGIADERGVYSSRNGLPLYWKRESLYGIDLQEEYTGQIKFEVLCGPLGVFSFIYGPNTYTIDMCGLADPLLARLSPGTAYGWRIGHFHRRLPKGYDISTISETNQITDPEIHAYYDTLRLIVRGPIFTRERMRAIIRMNFGLIPRIRHTNYE